MASFPLNVTIPDPVVTSATLGNCTETELLFAITNTSPSTKVPDS